uniref:Uncharacterized protein n=1 Tax=Xiphophorus couchianus TaxID=32473 RepID=A0A3B5KMD7_9TELE
MEERSFPNQYPDWDQGFAVSNAGAELDSDEKVQSKIKDLLQQMEEGLKTADPHDFSTYTGWTGLCQMKKWCSKLFCLS